MKPISILAFIICTVLPAFGADFYVSPKGSDNNNGSANSHWKTIQHAAKMAKSGDTVIVGPGNYPEMITVKSSGRKDAPIHFKSHQPHAAKIQGFVIQGDFVTIEGFAITNDNANGTGINAGEAHRDTAQTGCQMLGNYIHDISGTAIYSGTNALVKDNLMKNVGRGVFANSNSLIENNEVDTLIPQIETKNGKERVKKTQYNFFAGKDITFRGNYLHGTDEQYLKTSMGVCFFTTWDAWIFGPSENILIEGNRCFDATHASEPGANKLKQSSHFTYRNNLFVNTVYVGILCQEVSYVTVENNTFVNCGAYPVWFQTAHGAKGAVVRNNIIAYFNRDRVVEAFDWKPAESGIRNNVDPKERITSSNNLLWKTENRGYGDTDFIADPMFLDPANNDFRLKPESPAINAGAALANISTDIRGIQRPQNGKYDIGCYEFTPKEDAQ